MHSGFPGSCHDSYVFKRMQISQEPTKYFDENQYLLADSAYASGKYLIPCYQGNSLQDERKCKFNYYLAQSRVRIEHAIGILKGWWASLREMRTQLQNVKDMEQLINWVLCCVILHNMLAKINDQWNELFNDEQPKQPPQIYSSNSNINSLREILLPITLAHFQE